MLIIGLTGSIGMGKSTMAEVLRQNGIAVLDADQVVHDLYEGAAVPKIEAAFPGTTVNGKVDRQRLSLVLAKTPSAFKKLEEIVHPMVREAQATFLNQQNANGAQHAVLEIPLLFETDGDQRVDVSIVVSASAQSQAERVLDRPGMSREKLDHLLARQMSDAEKKALADFVVDTDLKPQESATQITDILAQISDRKGQAFERYWSQRR